MNTLPSSLKESVQNARGAAEYFTFYSQSLHQALSSVDLKAVDAACELLLAVRQAGRTVYVAGNGGSAAIADHLCCDWMKGSTTTSGIPLKVVSLVSNVPLLTAYANDASYEQALALQLGILGQPGDLAVLISSSGNSPNILAVADVAKECGIRTIGLTGFSGGKLKDKADLSLHVSFDDYGVVEDCHQSLMHVLAQHAGRCGKGHP